MYQALYRKWRPQTFDDVYGQEHITSVLKYETANSKFSHAYLFCGSRGTGKTTCAKILAKAVNCESPINGSPCNKCPSCMSIDSGAATDVLEMDAASNNGVDNIRDIRDEVVYMPSTLKYRVYIVDEVHMLSGSAFNALLKTLEEPPAHVVFVLATTELHKLPSTIISRCQRFDFRRISTDVLVERLKLIAREEGIDFDEEALRLIAKHAQGGMRDAISLLELCAGNRAKITTVTVTETIGSGGRENIEQTVRAIAASNFDAIFSVVNDVVRSSKDITVFWQELLSYYRDMLVMKTTESAHKYLDLTETEAAGLKKTAELYSKEALLAHCRMIDDALYAMQKAGAVKRIVAEMALIKLCDNTLDTSTESILARLSRLERRLASGAVSVSDVSQLESGTVTESAEVVSQQSAEPVGTIKTPQTSEKVSEPQMTEELKLFRGWNEIAEQAASGDMAVLPFLKMAKAFVSGNGSIRVRFPSDFAKGMADRDGVRNSIAAAFSNAMQKNISGGELIFELLEGTEEEVSDLDDLTI